MKKIGKNEATGSGGFNGYALTGENCIPCHSKCATCAVGQ